MGLIKEVAYTVLEALFGKRGLSKSINGIKVRLPVRYINYFPDDYEYENFNFLRQHLSEGDVVLDIGAHIGVFAVIAARYGGNIGKVYAFEPASATNMLLQKTIAINNINTVVLPYKAAMGAVSGKTKFYVSAIDGDNSNSLVAYKTDRDLFATEVDIFTVDDFVEQNKIDAVNFIKIDVEGAELDALRGARNTFLKHKPACILAIHPEPILSKGDSLEDIYNYIRDLGYTILHNNGLISSEMFCINRALIDLHLLPDN